MFTKDWKKCSTNYKYSRKNLEKGGVDKASLVGKKIKISKLPECHRFQLSQWVFANHNSNADDLISPEEQHLFKIIWPFSEYTNQMN